jgi:putative endonuclease
VWGRIAVGSASRFHWEGRSVFFRGAVAQLGARLDGIEEVTGSNPVGSTNSVLMVFYVNILQSEMSGRFYVGQTKNLDERFAYHSANYSKSLRNRGPWKLVYFERYPSRTAALQQEIYIKKQKSRRFIEALLSASR